MPAETGQWMPIYWADYFGDTNHLTTEQHGAYLLLIGTYWRRGKALPDDDEFLATVTKMSRKRWRIMRQKISQLFSIQDGEWIHKRVELEIDKSSGRLNSARANGRAGGLAKSKLVTVTRSTSLDKSNEGVALPIKVNGNHSPEPLKMLFDAGVSLLTAGGETEQHARTMIGKWRKDLKDDSKLMGIITQAATQSPVAPVAYIQGVIKLAIEPAGTGMFA